MRGLLHVQHTLLTLQQFFACDALLRMRRQQAGICSVRSCCVDKFVEHGGGQNCFCLAQVSHLHACRKYVCCVPILKLAMLGRDLSCISACKRQNSPGWYSRPTFSALAVVAASWGRIVGLMDGSMPVCRISNGQFGVGGYIVGGETFANSSVARTTPRNLKSVLNQSQMISRGHARGLGVLVSGHIESVVSYIH